MFTVIGAERARTANLNIIDVKFVELGHNMQCRV